MINVLIELLSRTKDKNMKAILLQSYIAEYGAVPEEYGDVIKDLLSGESDDSV